MYTFVVEGTRGKEIRILKEKGNKGGGNKFITEAIKALGH